MLRLYAGRENIDKERFIYDLIRERGGETFVLVPDQYTLVAEEQALEYLGTDCLFDTEILSMNRLGLRILTEQGTESVRMLDKYGRFMLLNLLVKEHIEDFGIFRLSAGRLGFTSMLNDFISEFKQQDCSLDEVEELLAGSGGDPILAAKLRELRGVIEAYEERISGVFTDSEDYISMYVSAIKDSKLVRGRTFWIYGYDSITPKFADAVIELAATAESVNFVVNRGDFGLDRRLMGSLTRLAADKNIDVSCDEIDEAAYRLERSETVSRMEQCLFSGVLTEEQREANRDFIPEDLTMVCAANPYYEAESAAAYIWHLVRDLGYRMRDIQVIANDEGAMQPVVRRVFAEYGLPVFADSSRDITDSAAVSFIVDMLEFVRSRKLPHYLFAMLKSGLTPFDDRDIEDLENYARSYRIKGSMWDKPFRYGADETGEEKFASLEAMREAVMKKISVLEALAKKDRGTVAEFTGAFRKYLEDEWQLGERVAEAAAGQEEAGLHDEAQRMTQSFEKALEILAQTDEIMGDSGMDLEEFLDIYEAGLSDVEVGVIPPTADGLSMGTMIRTRPGRIRAAVILGANEGVLPLTPSTEGLFSADEKEFFREKGFALGSLDDIKMDEENSAMYRMMAGPSDKIYLSWSMTDVKGADAGESPVIDMIRSVFPKTAEKGFVRKDIISEGWGLELVQDPDEAMRHLINRIKDPNAPDEPEALTAAMLKWYADNRREKLDAMLAAAAYDNDPKPLDRGTAGELYAGRDGALRLSASSIGRYVDCPFAYFVEKGLRPKEEREFASDARSVGDVYHECLMAVARQIMADSELPQKIREGDSEELERLVSSALDELSSGYRGGLFISTGSEEFRMSRIREICSAAAKAMAEQLSAVSVTSADFEEAFGRNGRFGPLSFMAGEDEVFVEGRIDRADYLEVGGSDRVRIIDYKTGSDRLDLWKMRQGLKMQLMIYMISASGEGLEPAGMFYFNIKDPIESANDLKQNKLDELSERKPEDTFTLKGAYINEEGILDAMPPSVLKSSRDSISREEYEEARADVLAQIEKTAEGILSGRIGINPLKNDNTLVCGYCSCKSICRRDRGYVRNRARSLRPKPKKAPAKEK
ncbi:MAG: PD-(D/E)XK nuclease family protein [Mogibacterium sp.]|nr:PD-(D/E)XK nuclease family protein [Mogibacterium sp.]